MKLLNTGQSVVGWHRHQYLLTCPQKYAYAYIEGIRSESGEAAELGTLVHQAIAHRAIHSLIEPTREIPNPEEYYRPFDAIEAQAEEMKVSNELKEKAKDIYSKYNSFYSEDEIDVLGVEQSLETTIDGELYTQRADLITQDKAGKRVIWDHKTGAGFLEGKFKTYTMSGQIHGLEYLGRKLWGDKFGGILLNMVGTTAPYKFFRRRPLTAPHMVFTFENQIRRARLVRDSFINTPINLYPKAADTTMCGQYGGCPYVDKCRFG